MDVLTVVLIILVACGIWFLIELALTVRKVRPAVDNVSKVVEEAKPTIEHIDAVVKDIQPLVAHIDDVVQQANPLVAHADEAVAQVMPSLNQITPLLENTTNAIDALSGDLRHLDTILVDVSTISGKAGNATIAVSDAASGLATKAKSLFSRQKQADYPKQVQAANNAAYTQRLPRESESSEPIKAQIVPEVVKEEAGYFTYPQQDEPVEMNI